MTISDPDDWPFSPNEFVPASKLRIRGASDQEVREAIYELEDSDSR